MVGPMPSTEAPGRVHVVLVPGFAGFDALGQIEYYTWIGTAAVPGPEELLANRPTAVVLVVLAQIAVTLALVGVLGMRSRRDQRNRGAAAAANDPHWPSAGVEP